MTILVLAMQDSAVPPLPSAELNVLDLNRMKKALTVQSAMTSPCTLSCFHSPVFRSFTAVMRLHSSTITPTRMIRTKPPIPVISTEETSDGISPRTVIVRKLFRANSSLYLTSWNISVWNTAYSTVMYRSALLIPGMILFLLSCVKTMMRNSSVSITSVNLTRLHGSMRTTACTPT